MQTASYACALQEELKEWRECENLGRMLVHMNMEKGSLQVYTEEQIQKELSGHDIQGDMASFAALRTVYDWDRANKNLWKTRFHRK